VTAHPTPDLVFSRKARFESALNCNALPKGNLRVFPNSDRRLKTNSEIAISIWKASLWNEGLDNTEKMEYDPPDTFGIAESADYNRSHSYPQLEFAQLLQSDLKWFTWA
jgi:hypothetical protein